MTHEGYTAAKCWSLAPTPSPLTMSTSKEGHLRGRKVLDLSQERQHDALALALALLPEKSLGGWTFSSLEGTGQRGGGASAQPSRLPREVKGGTGRRPERQGSGTASFCFHAVPLPTLGCPVRPQHPDLFKA